MKPKQSLECPGCSGTVMCLAGCRVGKHERTSRPPLYRRGVQRAYAIGRDAVANQYGPNRPVVARVGEFDRLSCGHEVARFHGKQSAQADHRRCRACLLEARAA